MRWLTLILALLVVGCKSDPNAKVVDSTPVVTQNSQDVSGERFAFKLPKGYQAFDLTAKDAEKMVDQIDVGKDPSMVKQMVRSAIASGMVKFFAFKKEYVGDFTPNVNVVVTQTPSKDLAAEFEGLKQVMASVGTVKQSRLDNAAGVIEMESELKSPTESYQTYQLIRLKGGESVTLTISFQEAQRSEIQETIDLAKKTFKTK